MAVIPHHFLAEMQAIQFAGIEQIRKQREGYEGYILNRSQEFAALQAERRELAGRVDRLEDQCKGAEAAKLASDELRQQVERENGELQKSVCEHAEKEQQALTQLETTQRDLKLNQQTVLEQEGQLAVAARNVATHQRLHQLDQERRVLENELQEAQAKMVVEQSHIVQIASLVTAVVFAILTWNPIAVFLGLGVGYFVSSMVIESAECPCMTPLYARQASILTRLRLLNEAIIRTTT